MSSHDAARQGNVAVIQECSASGIDLNEPDEFSGATPLIVAATFGFTEVAEELMDVGSELDVTNHHGTTALHTAYLLCHTEFVEALLAKGADKTIKENSGQTALDMVSGSFDTMKPTYDYVGSLLKPLGVQLDYERIKAARPKIAEMLT